MAEKILVTAEDARMLDAIVHKLGIEDTSEDPCEAIDKLILSASQARSVEYVASSSLIEALKKVKIELAALVHPYFPGTPAISDWPCANPGDRECLDAAWHIVADALKNCEAVS